MLLQVSVVGPVAPVPFRAAKTEEFLRGKMLSDETVAQAAQVLWGEVAPRTSPHRATKEYRYELLPAMLREVLTQAAMRAMNQHLHRTEPKAPRGASAGVNQPWHCPPGQV